LTTQFKEKLKAEKVLVQKSGYFARSAAPNTFDLDLIKQSAALASEEAFNGKSGVVGLDEDQGNQMRLIDFSRIKGGKPFNTEQKWFQDLLKNIGQK